MRSWSGPKILSSEITPKELYLNRRQWIAGSGAVIAASVLPNRAKATTSPEPLKATPNTAFKPSDPATDK